MKERDRPCKGGNGVPGKIELVEPIVLWRVNGEFVDEDDGTADELATVEDEVDAIGVVPMRRDGLHSIRFDRALASG